VVVVRVLQYEVDVHCVSKKNYTLFIFAITLLAMSHVDNFWQKCVASVTR